MMFMIAALGFLTTVSCFSPTVRVTDASVTATATATASKLSYRMKMEDYLWNAVSNGEDIVVANLIEDGVDVNKLHYGRSYLEIAAQNSIHYRFADMLGLHNPYIDVIKILIDAGANPHIKNHKGKTPLQHYDQFIILRRNCEIYSLLK